MTMIMMTDSTGCTFIFSEREILRMARKKMVYVVEPLPIEHAIYWLNINPRGEFYQIDDEYIEGVASHES